MLLGLMSHSSAIAEMHHYSFNIANKTSDKVNCQNVIYTLYLTDTYKRSNSINKKTWRAGQTYVRRYGIAMPAQKCIFSAYCVSLADGWPRQFNMQFDDCLNINAAFQLDESGKCILTKTK